jgi:hypothetical protein
MSFGISGLAVLRSFIDEFGFIYNRTALTRKSSLVLAVLLEHGGEETEEDVYRAVRE